MNENTIIEYENSIGKLVFAYDSALWVTDISGVSSVDVDISEARSTGQIGSSIANQSVQPRSFSMDGAVFEPIGINRAKLLDIIAPQVPSTLTILQNGESWFLDVTPQRTPEFTPGNGVQYFQTRLHAAYPYWRTTTSYAAQIAGLIAMLRFPFFTGGEWWISKFGDSFFSTIKNHGNVPIEFLVTLTARSALANPEIYHVDTQKWIRINKAMVAGERVVVSTMYGSKGVTCISAAGEITNGFRYLAIGSDLSLNLIPGSNLLRIDAASNREGLGVRIEAPEGVKSGV